ncbi:hypothetical protein QJQ45_028028 [Haematococcus lacustris]|nr:hypothetical protein QJQ45_028028 [Haematococcus lacustris]
MQKYFSCLSIRGSSQSRGKGGPVGAAGARAARRALQRLWGGCVTGSGSDSDSESDCGSGSESQSDSENAVWEVYLDPKWARQRLRLYEAQDRALEQFFEELEKDMAEVSIERHGHAKQLVVFFGVAGIGTGGGGGADAVLRACCKVVCKLKGAGQRRGRVVLVDEHRTTRVSSAVNGQQPCEEELDHEQPTRRAGWKPPAGQVEQRLLRPAWSEQRDLPVRGLMWCPVVAPRKPPQATCSSQAATQPTASEPGPSTPPPAKRSKSTKAEQAAEPTQPGKGKGKGKAAKANPAPQPGRWQNKDCNATLDIQRIGESRWRPLELCWWPQQTALPATGKEYPGLGYMRLRDKPPKAQQQEGIAEMREFVFDPDTQIGVGIDPGVTQAVSAASGVWDPATGQLMADQLRRWKLTKGEVKHASGLNNSRRDTERLLAPIKPHLQHLAAASSAGTSLEANLKHITVTLATWDALEREMAQLSMKRHKRAMQLVVFFGAATIGTAGGWGADAVLRACRKVVCRPRGTDQRRGRVVLVDEHRTSRVSSAVNGQQPCEEELDHEQPTRRAGWKPPAGQVEQRLVRPAWSQERGQPVRGMMWCPVVAPRKPPQAPRSSQEATQPAASEPGPSTPLPAKRSKRTKAEPGAAEPTKGKGKAVKAKPAPQPGRWLDRDCNAALNMQRIGESRWRPLELCYWPDQGALPAKGKEYPGLGYKRVAGIDVQSMTAVELMVAALQWSAITRAMPAAKPSVKPAAATADGPPIRKRGRPLGSKNKPKPAPTRQATPTPTRKQARCNTSSSANSNSATTSSAGNSSGDDGSNDDGKRWLAPIKPHLQHLAAASSAGTSLEANLKHITVTLATWDAVWEVYLDPKWARQQLRLYGAQDRALEQFFNKLEREMAQLSLKRHGRAKQLVVFFGAATIGTAGGWGADAVLRACRKVVCRPRGTDQRRGRVVLVDEHRTSRVSSAVNGQQPCEVELDHEQPTRRAVWKPPAGQVDPRLLRPAWSQERGQPVRGMMWCPVVAPRKPPQAPRSSQEATQPAALEPGPSTPLPAKRSKRTKAEPGAAEPTKGKGKGKAAKAKPAPQPGRWLDRDCNAALNMQRIGESRWRPLELCYWPEQGALPAKGKEYPEHGYKRVRDKPPKAQEQQQQPAEAQ